MYIITEVTTDSQGRISLPKFMRNAEGGIVIFYRKPDDLNGVFVSKPSHFSEHPTPINDPAKYFHSSKIDPKGRVIVPIKFRKVLPKELFIHFKSADTIFLKGH